MTPRRIVLFGAGSPLVADYEETCARLGLTIVAAVRNVAGPVYAERAPIAGVASLRPDQLAVPCVVPLFTPRNRAAAAGEAAALGFTFADALVDPTAIVASTSAAGLGTFVNAGCIVGASARFAEHVLVNRGASIGHHAMLEAFVSVGPGAVVAGNVTIETGASIGAGAVVLPKRRIGAHAVVGAGAVVVHDVAPGTTVIGNPARVLTAPVR
ncbi:MAG TPA: hypothetical protein VGC96_04120 [Candidatus Elarobacter sp.]|jgi:hypothetical protein